MAVNFTTIKFVKIETCLADTFQTIVKIHRTQLWTICKGLLTKRFQTVRQIDGIQSITLHKGTRSNSLQG